MRVLKKDWYVAKDRHQVGSTSRRMSLNNGLLKIKALQKNQQNFKNSNVKITYMIK